jgi:hypothetical protein
MKKGTPDQIESYNISKDDILRVGNSAPLLQPEPINKTSTGVGFVHAILSRCHDRVSHSRRKTGIRPGSSPVSTASIALEATKRESHIRPRRMDQ